MRKVLLYGPYHCRPVRMVLPGPASDSKQDINGLFWNKAELISVIPEAYGLVDLRRQAFVLPDPLACTSCHQPKALLYIHWNCDKAAVEAAAKALVYLNGSLIPFSKRTFCLPDEGWLSCNGQILWCFGFWLLVPAAFGLHSPQILCRQTLSPPGGAPAPWLSEPAAPEVIQIEELHLYESEEESSGSSAALMALGSIGALASTLAAGTRNFWALGASAAGSLGMAGAFWGWNRWSLHRKRQLQKQKQRRTVREYLRYLEDCAQKMERIRKERDACFEREWKRIVGFDPVLRTCASGRETPWQLPVGIEEVPGIDLRVPQIPWNEQAGLPRKALEQLTRLPVQTRRWVVCRQNEQIHLEGWSLEQIQQLCLLWCWMLFRPSRRIGWIGFERPEVIHPASRIEEEVLYFDTPRAFLSCKSRHPEIEWTLFLARTFDLDLSDCTVLTCVFPEAEDASGSKKPDPRLLLSFSAAMAGSRKNLRLTIPSSACLFEPLTSPQQKAEAERVLKESRYFPLEEKELHQGVQPSCLHQTFDSSGLANMSVELAPGLFWNLQKEGPHALVAGATGSGKSEALCTVLFQLAFQNRASVVQFVLIDFKGGSFCVPLEDLPHTAAMLTNLEGRQIRRLEEALKTELDRRQAVLSQALLTHPARQPDLEGLIDPQSGDFFSHLVICVDEFGQLKARCPEFLKFLQESARIGRSLNVHLILCTQKPAGLVDEQIWANSRSRLCFSVLDEADSREVLGHERAAMLAPGGHFYLQCTGSCEKSGRAFYLKEPSDGFSRLFLRSQPGGDWQEVSTLTLQESMRQTILARQEKRRWLMVPDPAARAGASSALWIDRIHGLEPFELRHGSHVALCGRKENLVCLLEHLLSDGRQQVVSASRLTPFLGEAQSLASLWLLSTCRKPVTLVLDLDGEPAFSLIKTLMANPSIRLLLAAETVHFRQDALLQKMDLKICAGLSSRDQLSLFTSGKLREEEAWPACSVLCADETMRLCVGLKPPEANLSWQDPAQNPDGFAPVVPVLREQDLNGLWARGLIGISPADQRPFFLPRQGLSVVWAREDGRLKAESLRTRLAFEDPVRTIVNIPEPGRLCFFSLADLAPLSEGQQRLKEALESGITLFLGSGIETWQYALQLRLPGERKGDALWIEQGKGTDLQAASSGMEHDRLS